MDLVDLLAARECRASDSEKIFSQATNVQYLTQKQVQSGSNGTIYALRFEEAGAGESENNRRSIRLSTPKVFGVNGDGLQKLALLSQIYRE